MNFKANTDPISAQGKWQWSANDLVSLTTLRDRWQNMRDDGHCPAGERAVMVKLEQTNKSSSDQAEEPRQDSMAPCLD